MKHLLKPSTVRKLKRFYSLKRGFWSLVLILLFIFTSLVAETWVNKRALFVSYNGSWHFPVVQDVIPGHQLGLDYAYEAKYRELREKAKTDENLVVILPLIPYGPNEVLPLKEDESHPKKPSFQTSNYLGTDTSGRDVAARLVYGFRIAILFSLLYVLITKVIGIFVGCSMGYFAGWYDILLQRLIEIIIMIPFLYVIMIVASIVTPNFWILMGIMIPFGWTGVTFVMRSATYKEKERAYIMAAKNIGLTDIQIIFKHVIPNTLSIIITFIPFSISSMIVGLTTLDFLGFGLPKPTPSWGELLKIGFEEMRTAPWILISVIVALATVLTLITFIGESVREAFDPKKFSWYE